MRKLPAPPSVHWWDWTSVVLLILLLETLAARLIATEWTPSLGLIRGFTWMGAIIGLSLGYSIIPQRRARWLSFFYMIFMLPLQWTTIIKGEVSLEEKLSSVGGRLWFSLTEFFAKQPVDDPLFFIAIMSVIFWALSASAGYQLTRRQNFIAATLPSMFGILIIQNYDNILRGRIWVLAFFAALALLLLGRMNFLREQKRWKDKHIFLSPENGIDLSSGMAIAAGLLIVVAWVTPTSLIRIETARKAWHQITQPWTEFTNRFENAVSALESQAGGAPSTEFYGSQLELGLGFSLSESVMFTVEAPDLPSREAPPRYYWRGKVYDRFSSGKWTATGTQRKDFSPDTPVAKASEDETTAKFIFRVGEQPVTLLFEPAQTIWISRPGSNVHAPAAQDLDILSWNAAPGLLPGETYQAEAVLNNPNIEELRAAGVEYPQWVTDRYLQLPGDVSTRITELALEITANAETPYDKATAITLYLRDNIEYAPSVPEPPFGADPLEWVLFKHKQAYCVYYASLEVVMLRSLGIPARMAVGFAEGTPADRVASGQAEDEPDTTTFTVRKINAHAWPEVYFPSIGWVEFEPTGNQAPLDRPHAPRENEPNDGIRGPTTALLEPESDFSRDKTLPGIDAEPTVTTASRAPLIILLSLSVVVAGLALYLSRRYAIPARLPSVIRASIERGGIETPLWVLNWERWMTLSPIERSFESVNFALRLLKSPLPIHATPIERADKLTAILPDLSYNINTLLDEHQTSLYTSRTADIRRAKRAARAVRYQALLARIRYFWTGKYSPRP